MNKSTNTSGAKSPERTPTHQPDAIPPELEDLKCSICYEVLYQPVTTRPCLHTFCGSCLKKTFQFAARRKYKCPMCRAEVRDAPWNHEAQAKVQFLRWICPDFWKPPDEIAEMERTYKQGDSIFPDAVWTTTLNQTQPLTISEELSRVIEELDRTRQGDEATMGHTHSSAERTAMHDRIITHVDRTLAESRRIRTVAERLFEATEREIPPAEYMQWFRDDPQTWAGVFGVQLPPGTASETIVTSLLQEMISRHGTSMSTDGTSVSTAQEVVADDSLGEDLDASNHQDTIEQDNAVQEDSNELNRQHVDEQPNAVHEAPEELHGQHLDERPAALHEDPDVFDRQRLNEQPHALHEDPDELVRQRLNESADALREDFDALVRQRISEAVDTVSADPDSYSRGQLISQLQTVRDELNEVHRRGRPERVPALLERLGAITGRLAATPDRIRRAYESANWARWHGIRLQRADQTSVRPATVDAEFSEEINWSLHGGQRDGEQGSGGANDGLGGGNEGLTEVEAAQVIGTTTRPIGVSTGVIGATAGMVGATAELMEPAAQLVGTSPRLMGDSAGLVDAAAETPPSLTAARLRRSRRLARRQLTDHY